MEIDERTRLLDETAHRAAPSIDFFIFSLVSGLILTAGLAFDQFALLVLGASLAPMAITAAQAVESVWLWLAARSARDGRVLSSPVRSSAQAE